MKQRHTLSYTISSIVIALLFCVSANTQNNSIPSSASDSITYKLKYGLRIGGDIGKLIRSFTDNEYSGFEVIADYRIKNKLYIAGELGIEEKNTVTDYLDVTTKGSYLKGGIDYNLYQNWLDMDNMIFSGFRLGASSFNHTRNRFQIYSTDQYWTPQYTDTENRKFSNLTALWIELMIGIKAELFNNLYLGLNLQLKGLVKETEPNGFENLYIPGFNKTYDSSGIGVGYGYTLSYRVPLYKKDKKN
ncbi:DUF6048 family protein [Aestuariivivens sp. NBU2969]|uniref:DUF6048 family protein n=1 Tax=Aestuariivivens sp. NBU2969 TaxID=2873267 RepID=UPI001CBDB8C1|nr:DUF6048 family protein [Aestuariivivens sp. NBU2969]